MADLPVQPVLNYGQMLGSYGESLAAQQNASTAALTAHAQLPQIAANTAMAQTQTAGAELANQKTAMQLGLLQRLTQPPIVNDQSAPHSADTSGVTPAATSNGDTLQIHDGGIDPAAITAGMQKQFAVRDQWTPQELQQLSQAPLYAAAGIPGMDQVAMQQHKARIDTLTSQAQLGASNAYDQSYAVSTAPDGSRLAVLKTIHPDAAAAIQKIADQKDWTPEQTDQYVKTYADEVGNAAHKYSGRGVEVGKDGIARDTQTNQPVLGGAPAGVTPEAHADIVQKSTALVDTFTNGVTTKVPQWRASGYSSAGAYQNAALANGGVAPPPPRLGSTAPAAPKVPGAPAPTVGGNAAPPPPGAAPAPGAAPKAADPALTAALADTSFRQPAVQIPDGRAATKAETDAQAAPVTQAAALRENAAEVTASSARALQNFQAAKILLETPSDHQITGLPGQVAAELSRLGFQNQTADQRAEAAKYLTNGALGGLKSTYGSKPAMFDVKVNLEQAFPDIKTQGLGAAKNLVDSQIRAAQYDLASAGRVDSYLGKNPTQPLNQPTRFNEWNEKNFSRSAGVNQPPVMPTPSAASLAHLAAHPELAPQFKARYGYLPGAAPAPLSPLGQTVPSMK
jgi:hypothetical protein